MKINAQQVTRGIANKGFSGMRSSSPASIFVSVDRDVAPLRRAKPIRWGLVLKMKHLLVTWQEQPCPARTSHPSEASLA